MDLGYTEFQELLRTTAREFAERDFPIARHRALVDAGRTTDPETWATIARLGWPGLLVEERYGGTGAGWVDLVVLLDEYGRALGPPTLLAQTHAAATIREFATEEQRAALLPRLVAGDPICAVAILEARATFDAAGVQCRARESSRGYILDGAKHFVRGGNAADRLLVLGRLGDGIGVFIIDARTPGISIEPLPNIGDDDQARVTLAGVEVGRDALLGGRAHGWDALRRVADLGALIECGYAVGIMGRDTEMTINYVKDRVQFGRPLGSFQAVQHQVADQVTDLDASRYLTYYAAWAMDERLPDTATWIARAKALVSDALRRVTRTANQLHGGIGFSREYDLHFYYQRAKTCELMFGTAAEHRERVAAALLD